MGLGQATFATVAIADARLIVPIPEHLSFAEAAALPVAFLTALYALEDVAALRPGERVLVHAAVGGVGMAAVHLARLIGAEVFATASPIKWSVLEAMQFDAAHIASSRDAMSTASFLATTAGEGMDVVLGALSGDFVDASLRLLPRGGRYIEMGKTDVRELPRRSRSPPRCGLPRHRSLGCRAKARSAAPAKALRAALSREARAHPALCVRSAPRPSGVPLHAERAARG